MKKLIFFGVLFSLYAILAEATFKKEVIIFSQPCHYCEKMKEALDNGIIAANPDIKFTILDLQKTNNNKLLRQYAKKYNLRGDIGLPLLFIGKNYMMGWGPNSAEELQSHLEQLREEKISRIPTSAL